MDGGEHSLIRRQGLYCWLDTRIDYIRAAVTHHNGPPDWDFSSAPPPAFSPADLACILPRATRTNL